MTFGVLERYTEHNDSIFTWYQQVVSEKRRYEKLIKGLYSSSTFESLEEFEKVTKAKYQEAYDNGLVPIFVFDLWFPDVPRGCETVIGDMG